MYTSFHFIASSSKFREIVGCNDESMIPSTITTLHQSYPISKRIIDKNTCALISHIQYFSMNKGYRFIAFSDCQRQVLYNVINTLNHYLIISENKFVYQKFREPLYYTVSKHYL